MAGYSGVALVACLAALVHVSSAATYTVGDSTGWTIPPSPSLYSSWAAKQTFNVGDALMFNFPSGAHTVAEVSKSAYDACTTTNPITTFTNGPATVTLATAGAHYYICTIPTHCSKGQKLAITASAAASPTAPATSPLSPATAPTPSSGSPVTIPSPASGAPTPPSASSSTAASPASGTTSPASSTTPSTVSSPAGGPSTSTTPASPSSGSAAASGLALPILLIGAAFLF